MATTMGVAPNEGDDVPATAGDIAGNPTTQSGDPGRFGVETAGYYQFSIDFSTKKYTLTPYSTTGATSFSSIEVQGSSTTTTALTALAIDTHMWYAAALHLTPGDLTFVTNTGSAWGGSTGFSGVATDGDESIPVIVEDDYDVWFNDLTGRYILVPLNL